MENANSLVSEADSLLEKAIYCSDDAEALELLDEAIKLYPDFQIAYLERAIRRIELEQFSEALDDLKTNLGLLPVGKGDGSIDEYFIGLQGNNRFYRGIVKIGMGEYEDAVIDIFRGMQITVNIDYPFFSDFIEYLALKMKTYMER